MKACFIGHRTIEKTGELSVALKETVERLIRTGVTTFLFGSKSVFDNLSWRIVTELKKEYPYIKRVYVRAVYRDIEQSYEKYLLKSYDETYFPQKIEKAGKYAYVERNCEMIDSSTYCIFYYDEDYDAPLGRNSGTKIAYRYAQKQKKEIINLCKE